MEHIHGNWPGELPVVYRWPYDYSKPGHSKDFIPQTVPYSQTRESNLEYDVDEDPQALKEQKEWEATQQNKP